MIEINENQCNGCKHKRDTFIFQLCKHNQSEYKVADKMESDFHTRIHMIRIQGGVCKIKEI